MDASARYIGLATGLELQNWMNVLSFQFQKSKKEREVCEFKKAFKKSFLLLFLSKYFLRGQVLKRIGKMTYFVLK